MGEVIRLGRHQGAGDSQPASLGTLRRLAGMEPGAFAAAIAAEAGQPVGTFVYLAYEADDSPPPPHILAAANRVAVRSRHKAAAGLVVTRPSSPPGILSSARTLLTEWGVTTRACTPQPHQDSGDEVAAAVQEAEADQSWLLGEPGQQPVDVLWQEALELARAGNRTPAQTFSASHQLRRHALALANETRRPRALSDLYVIAGQATALMASTAFDLNLWDASAALARSAISYAAFVGESSLHTWTRGLAATLANWRSEPDVALSHFSKGMEIAPAGTPKARLRYIAARSFALLGDVSSVREVLDQARRDQDDAANHHDVLSDETAGEFAFGAGRAEACAAAAWLDLGRGREAATAARRALDDLTAPPGSRQPRSQVMGARIDLASALLFDGDLDAAEDALKLVTGAPASLKNVSLSGRLSRTREILASPRWAVDPAARRLSSSIAE